MGLVLSSSILSSYLLNLSPAKAHVTLQDSIKQMQTVEVTTQKYTSPLRSLSHGTRQWQLSSLHYMPKIMGNSDPLHMAELLPGVQTTSEYDSGIHIWGCDNAHNEVSIDGTILYGVQHLLGFFSVFNASHFQTMTYSPAVSLESSSNRLGGLLRMESMDKMITRITGELSVGPMSSQGTLRLPLGKHTLLVASAREAYLNLFYSQWLKIDDEQMRYSFGDYNLTLLHSFSERDRLRLNFYAGHDNVGFDTGLYQANTSLKWGNQMISLDHQHLFDERNTFKQTLSFSRYASKLDLHQQEISFSLPANIADISYRSQMDWNAWHFGADVSVLRVQPQSPALEMNNRKNYETTRLQHVQQYSLHAQYNWNISNQWLIRPAFKGLIYVDDLHRGHVLPSPSLTIEWNKANIGNVSFHYAWQQQPLFQTGITSLGLPVEFWLAAGRYSKPQNAHHFSLSHDIIFCSGQWGLTTSIYFKRLFNQIEYKGNILDFMNTRYELGNSLLQGDGYNYGLNIMLTRRTGAVTGWISYSFSRSLRHFNNPLYPNLYPSNHERPHELNAVATWRISKHWSVGGTFVFSSGTPFTSLQYLYLMNHSLLAQQGEHNGNRLKPYTRLDLSANYDLKNTNRYECGFNLSLYNASFSNNQLYYRLRIYKNTFAYRPRSFLLSMLPSINFYIKWK